MQSLITSIKNIGERKKKENMNLENKTKQTNKQNKTEQNKKTERRSTQFSGGKKKKTVKIKEKSILNEFHSTG